MVQVIEFDMTKHALKPKRALVTKDVADYLNQMDTTPLVADRDVLVRYGNQKKFVRAGCSYLPHHTVLSYQNVLGSMVANQIHVIQEAEITPVTFFQATRGMSIGEFIFHSNIRSGYTKIWDGVLIDARYSYLYVDNTKLLDGMTEIMKSILSNEHVFLHVSTSELLSVNIHVCGNYEDTVRMEHIQGGLLKQIRNNGDLVTDKIDISIHEDGGLYFEFILFGIKKSVGYSDLEDHIQVDAHGAYIDITLML